MDDLMSREMALKALEEISYSLWEIDIPSPTVPEYIEHHEQVQGVMKLVDGWARKIQAAMPVPAAEPQWIPCSERSPKKERAVYWVCTNTGYQCECRWTNNQYGLGESDEWDWSVFDTPQYSYPVAWRPLPAPYKEGEQE